MPTRLPASRSSALGLLVLAVLLFGPAASVVGAAVRQAQPGGLDMTVLVHGTADVATAGEQSLSASRVTFGAGQASRSVVAMGTTFLVVEKGTALLAVDQRLPGLHLNRGSDPEFGRMYDLGEGVRVTLQPGTQFKVRNDGEIPTIIYLVSLAPVDTAVGR